MVVAGAVVGVAVIAAAAVLTVTLVSDDSDDTRPLSAAPASEHSGEKVPDDASATSTPTRTPDPNGGSVGRPPADPTYAPTSGSAGCRPPAPGTPSTQRFASEPPMGIDKSKSHELRLDTTCGTITVKLEAAKAPRTVNSLSFLAGKGYFDHSPCHRLTTSGIHVLQCGDPTGTGTGTPGYRFPDENLSGATYPAGTLAMANAGPGTNGSQFFLVYKDTQLPPSYTPFGTVTGGMDVLGRIAAGGTEDGTGDGAPRLKVVIDTAKVTASG